MRIFDSIRIKNVNFKNRVVMAPMVPFGMPADQDGMMGNELLHHYLQRTANGMGLMICQSLSVTSQSRSGSGEMEVYMDNTLQTESISNWVQKDKLEQALMVGMHRAPELKHDEKIYYLGEFKERVLKKLTKKQVLEAAVYPEIIQSLKDPRANKLIIDGSLSGSSVQKYRKLARKLGVPNTERSDPEFKGDTGLIIVSDQAVAVEDITIPERSIRLEELGLSSALARAAGRKLCKTCLQKVAAIDKNELINYRKLTWADRLCGDRCPGHDKVDAGNFV
ncbi:YueI family protein [Sporomusa termitida]|uniref:NADPH dehydrogenase n=1 Tax=Sporomusa termitida TaxID=2377 RepID=A0A517DVA9_9FIRM|nr:YueI family protein [Sporomusa termitida]QDR81278.1 NADPH dehydrogenase [Sporomusa termitida]